VRRSLLALVLVAVAALTMASPVAGQPHARLALAASQPPKLRGAGFHGHERVRVVLRERSGATVVRHLVATASGRFVVSFAGLSEPCVRFSVTATGTLGSRASLAGIKLPYCIVR
jgi:hypothetical protein